MKINDAMKKLVMQIDLSEDEVREVMEEIMRGEATSSQKGGFLIGLKVKGETSEELLGAVKALRKETVKVDVEEKENLIDCCGTGGDGANTFNISTAVAIIAASGGVKVAKHGNRVIEDKGMAFLLAPSYNKGMKNVAKERLELGTRTLFNMVGPLLNPAPLTGQLMGVYDGNLIETVGDVLLNLGLERAMVVHGDDGLDEITTTTTTTVCEVKNGKLYKYILNPSDYGIELCKPEALVGGTPNDNAKIIVDILKGKGGPKRDIVVLNTGAALYVAKVVDSLKDGIKLARDLIYSGKAYDKYLELRSA